MRIGFDASRITTPQRTGTENYSFYLARALAGVDKSNEYVLYFRDSLSSEAFAEISLANPAFGARVLPWPRLWTQGGLAWECLTHPPDILFIPAHTVPVIRRPSLRTVVTIHDLGFEYLPEYHQFPQKLYLDKMTKYAALCASHLIAVSKSTKADLIRQFKVPEGKVTVVYEGVDRNRFLPPRQLARRRGGVAEEVTKLETEEVKERYNIRGPYILFVGTVQPRKNLRRLIEAFSMITGPARALHGPGLEGRLQLVIAGRPGWLFDDIYSAPRDFGVEDRVLFLGHVSDKDLSSLYRGAICFCLPSLYEGFGLPVLEAMASGVPVVTANISSLPEVGGEAAIYVDPYDVDSIARGLGEVLGSYGTTRYAGWVRKGFDQLAKFTWERCARETLQVFNAVADT